MKKDRESIGNVHDFVDQILNTKFILDIGSPSKYVQVHGI